MNEIPTPSYEYDIAVLRSYYERALSEIEAELTTFAGSDFTRAQLIATEMQIKWILEELDEATVAWVASNVPVAATDGIALTLVSLGLADSVSEAREMAVFSTINQAFVETAVADLQDDLLEVTDNTRVAVVGAIRSAAKETFRENLIKGNNATGALKTALLAKFDEATRTGIVDAAGRTQAPESYAEMAVRTKMAETQRKVAQNEAIGRGIEYGIISRHNATDDCKKWEGKVVRLVAKAQGDYPFIGDLPRREIFHPNCRHVVTPIGRLDRLPDDLKRLNKVN